MTYKNAKTILFASLLVAMILPFSMMMADATTNENVNDKGKTIIKSDPRNADIPLFNERQQLLKAYDASENVSVKADKKRQLDVMTEKIQIWHDKKFDQAKYDKAIDAKKTLREKLSVLQEGKGDMKAYETLPWVTRSYDYTNNALEIRIDSKYFTEENIPKYIKTIRTLIGDEVDITLASGEARTPESCTSRSTSECDPIKGGVKVTADDEGLATVGFKATYNGKTGFVTAGHLFVDENGNQRSGTIIKQHPSSSTDIGNLETNNLFKGVSTWCDCAFVSELHENRSMDDGVYGWSDPNSTENPYWNQLVIMSGGNSGLTAGYVTSTSIDYAIDLDDNGTFETVINDAIDASYPSQDGDSGSPIISWGGNLVGMHSASYGTFMQHSAITNSFPGLSWGF